MKTPEELAKYYPEEEFFGHRYVEAEPSRSGKLGWRCTACDHYSNAPVKARYGPCPKSKAIEPLLREALAAQRAEGRRELWDAAVDAMGHLQVVAYYAQMIRLWKDDPNAAVLQWADKIQEFRLKAHESLRALKPAAPKEGESK